MVDFIIAPFLQNATGFCYALRECITGPLKLAIQRELQDPLALDILTGKFREGETIVVERGREGLEFRM